MISPAPSLRLIFLCAVCFGSSYRFLSPLLRPSIYETLRCLSAVIYLIFTFSAFVSVFIYLISLRLLTLHLSCLASSYMIFVSFCLRHFSHCFAYVLVDLHFFMVFICLCFALLCDPSVHPVSLPVWLFINRWAPEPDSITRPFASKCILNCIKWKHSRGIKYWRIFLARIFEIASSCELKHVWHCS